MVAATLAVSGSPNVIRRSVSLEGNDDGRDSSGSHEGDWRVAPPVFMTMRETKVSEPSD